MDVGIVGVAGITVICYLIGQIIKATGLDIVHHAGFSGGGYPHSGICRHRVWVGCYRCKSAG